MREQAEVLRLVTDATGDDRRVNPKALCERHHRQRRGIVLNPARSPDILRDEAILRPFVRFVLSRIAAHSLHVAKAQIVDKGLTPHFS